jgi:hypothetical protein
MVLGQPLAQISSPYHVTPLAKHSPVEIISTDSDTVRMVLEMIQKCSFVLTMHTHKMTACMIAANIEHALIIFMQRNEISRVDTP